MASENDKEELRQWIENSIKESKKPNPLKEIKKKRLERATKLKNKLGL